MVCCSIVESYTFRGVFSILGSTLKDFEGLITLVASVVISTIFFCIFTSKSWGKMIQFAEFFFGMAKNHQLVDLGKLSFFGMGRAIFC